MGLFKFLGELVLMDESSKKVGTVPTILSAAAINEILHKEKNDYRNQVNKFWKVIQNTDLSQSKKDLIFKCCNRLVRASSDREREKIIDQIDYILNSKYY